MFKKIDIFQDGKYLCSTLWSKTCREAIQKISKKGSIQIQGKITAHFHKD